MMSETQEQTRSARYELREIRMDELVFDRANVNLHTPEGMAALEESIQRNGIGRSILVAKDGRVLAGNATLEKIGETNAATRIVEITTRGDTLVVVRREDVDGDSDEARRLALADNRVAQINYQEDSQRLAQQLIELAGERDDTYHALLGTGYAGSDHALALLERAQTGPEIPDVEPRAEPNVKSGHTIFIHCSAGALAEMEATLERWAQRSDVTVNVS